MVARTVVKRRLMLACQADEACLVPLLFQDPGAGAALDISGRRGIAIGGWPDLTRPSGSSAP